MLKNVVTFKSVNIENLNTTVLGLNKRSIETKATTRKTFDSEIERACTEYISF